MITERSLQLAQDLPSSLVEPDGLVCVTAGEQIDIECEDSLAAEMRRIMGGQVLDFEYSRVQRLNAIFREGPQSFLHGKEIAITKPPKGTKHLRSVASIEDAPRTGIAVVSCSGVRPNPESRIPEIRIQTGELRDMNDSSVVLRGPGETLLNNSCWKILEPRV